MKVRGYIASGPRRSPTGDAAAFDIFVVKSDYPPSWEGMRGYVTLTTDDHVEPSIDDALKEIGRLMSEAQRLNEECKGLRERSATVEAEPDPEAREYWVRQVGSDDNFLGSVKVGPGGYGAHWWAEEPMRLEDAEKLAAVFQVAFGGSRKVEIVRIRPRTVEVVG